MAHKRREKTKAHAKHVENIGQFLQDRGSTPRASTNNHSLLAEVLTLASSFLSPFRLNSKDLWRFFPQTENL